MCSRAAFEALACLCVWICALLCGRGWLPGVTNSMLSRTRAFTPLMGTCARGAKASASLRATTWSGLGATCCLSAVARCWFISSESYEAAASSRWTCWLFHSSKSFFTVAANIAATIVTGAVLVLKPMVFSALVTCVLAVSTALLMDCYSSTSGAGCPPCLARSSAVELMASGAPMTRAMKNQTTACREGIVDQHS